MSTLDELRVELAEYAEAKEYLTERYEGISYYQSFVSALTIAIADVTDRMESRRFELRSIINRCEIKQPEWEDYDPQPHIDELRRHEQATKGDAHES